MRRVTLASPADIAGWRREARRLLLAGIRPEHVVFETEGGQPDLLARAPLQPPQPAKSPTIRVPRAFVALAEAALCHSHPERFARLYRLLWRLQRERGLLAIASDADVLQARAWEKAVRRDVHKMHAFVRFRSLPTPDREAHHDDGETFVAWFEPDHHIVERAAPFFKNRFATMRWSILTPKGSVHWDRRRLRFTGPKHRADAPPDDALDDWWRVYYRSIFNPARLKIDAMRAEMPKKYWQNMPETRLIPELIAEAGSRTRAMLDTTPTKPSRRHQRLQARLGPADDGEPSA